MGGDDNELAAELASLYYGQAPNAPLDYVPLPITKNTAIHANDERSASTLRFVAVLEAQLVRATVHASLL